jgi:hypothetical protein
MNLYLERPPIHQSNLMAKVWTSYAKNDDKIIAFANDTIYKGNPKNEEDIVELSLDLKSGLTQNSNLFEIPVSYLREIRLRDEKPFIEVFFGNEGEELLRVADKARREEIFHYLRTAIPNNETTTEKYSRLKAGRKPLIAFLVVLAIFVLTLFFAMEGESGNIYYMEDGHYNSLTGMVVALASIGVNNVILLFSILLGLAGLSFFRKAKNPPVVQRMVVKR